MFRLSDLIKKSSNSISSSTDIEQMELRQQILRLTYITLLITAFVVSVIIILFILFLPGLFNVFFAIAASFAGSLLFFWPVLVVLGLIFIVLFYLSLRNS